MGFLFVFLYDKVNEFAHIRRRHRELMIPDEVIEVVVEGAQERFVFAQKQNFRSYVCS